MELLKGLSSPMHERVKSPLYGSFVSSWLIWNWKIVLAVIFVSKYNLEGKNLAEFIYIKYLNICDALWIPLTFSLLYIFLLPQIDYFILWYTERVKRRKIDKKIEVGRKHKVEGNLYYDLLGRYENEKAKLLTYEENLSKSQAELSGLHNNYRSQQTTISQLEERLTKLRNRHSAKDFFKGRWTLTFGDRNNKNFHGTENININEDSYNIVGNNQQETQKFKLKLIDFDPERETLKFVKYNLHPHEGHCVDELRIIDNDRLEGMENETITVTYVRNKFVEPSDKT